ncbi:MAG: hypothetical protein MZV70_34695 [Desulfobacterales bacterium]|nr:hypothetical protein [Desulfobacterales bacterium]
MIAFRMARMLQDEGVFANVAVSPAVPPGRPSSGRVIWPPTPMSTLTRCSGRSKKSAGLSASSHEQSGGAAVKSVGVREALTKDDMLSYAYPSAFTVKITCTPRN